MKDHDLDRIIDAATGQMMSQEPSDAFAEAVMARVRSAHESKPRRFVWATVGASAAASAVIAILMLNSAPEPGVENPGRAVPAPTTTERTAPVAVQPDSDANVDSAVVSPDARPLRMARVSRAVSDPPMTQAEFEALAGTVAFESISPQPIELAAIVVESAPIDQIVIDAIVIEPLLASND